MYGTVQIRIVIAGSIVDAHNEDSTRWLPKIFRHFREEKPRRAHVPNAAVPGARYMDLGASAAGV